MLKIGPITLEASGVLIALGGLYDIFTPKLPPNLASICGADDQSSHLVRQLLKALGACLLAVGVTVIILAAGLTEQNASRVLALIFILVLPSEGFNALGMYRVGSPYTVPLLLIALTLYGVLLT